MHYTFQANRYELSYLKDPVENQILWEHHCHALYEMIAVLEGDVSVVLEGQSYRLHPNQCMIIPPLCYHSVVVNQAGAYRRITVFFDRSAIPSVLQEKFARRETSHTMHVLPFPEEFSKIFQTEPSPYYTPLIESLMVRLFYRHAEAADAENGDGGANRLMSQITSYIDRHLCDDLTLDTLVRHTALSKSSICHIFKEKMGVPPGQYILQKRMAYAEKLLREGHPATVVATELGYKNYATFYRAYHKHCGVNPQKTKPPKRFVQERAAPSSHDAAGS